MEARGKRFFWGALCALALLEASCEASVPTVRGDAPASPDSAGTGDDASTSSGREDAGAPPTLALGQSVGARFEPLAELADVPVVRGTQGADMIVLAVRVSGRAPRQPVLSLVATTEDGQLLAALEDRRELGSDVAGTWLGLDYFLAFRVEVPTEAWHDRLVDVRATLVLEGGGSSAAVRLRARATP